MNTKILYEGYLIELFEYDSELSWRILKKVNDVNIQVITCEYRTKLSRELIICGAQQYIDGLLVTNLTLEDYDNLPLY